MIYTNFFKTAIYRMVLSECFCIFLSISDLTGFSLREKCPYSELFWSTFSRIWTEYGEIRNTSRYSVRMRENADENNSEYDHFLRSVCHTTHLTIWYYNFSRFDWPTLDFLLIQVTNHFDNIREIHISFYKVI